MFQTGIVVITTSCALRRGSTGAVSQLCAKFVKDLTYVHLISESTVSELRWGIYSASNRGSSESTAAARLSSIPLSSCLRRFITDFYTRTAAANLNIRFLLSNITTEPPSPVTDAGRRDSLQHSYDVIFTDLQLELHAALKRYLEIHFPPTAPTTAASENHDTRSTNSNKDVDVKLITVTEDVLNNADPTDSSADSSSALRTYSTVCLGGTFDRLHVGHKILLSEACLLCNKALTVGVTDGDMNKRKVLSELMQSLADRCGAIKQFLSDIKPSIVHRIVPITDPFGPTVVEPELECLVVSRETERGGTSINQIRGEKGMPPMEIDIIELVEAGMHLANEEHKVSSSSTRMRLLGTLLREPSSRSLGAGLARRPYVIGLTGSTASGKSSIGQRLQRLGATVVDCDQLGHQSYLPGSESFQRIIAEFGDDVISQKDGSIDRRMLGAKVFSNRQALDKLNSIVWPAIAELARRDISAAVSDVVVLDAAVLLEAGWNTMVHEIWTTVIPKDEAKRRLMERNKLSETEAELRISSQLTNEERVLHANVVLSTFWEPHLTQTQVEKAWSLLQERILRERYYSRDD